MLPCQDKPAQQPAPVTSSSSTEHIHGGNFRIVVSIPISEREDSEMGDVINGNPKSQKRGREAQPKTTMHERGASGILAPAPKRERVEDGQRGQHLELGKGREI
jgi:hypothetical protein